LLSLTRSCTETPEAEGTFTPEQTPTAEIAKQGTPAIKRAYGDDANLVSWKEELLRHAIQSVQQFAYTRREEFHRLGAQAEDSQDGAISVVDLHDCMRNYTGGMTFTTSPRASTNPTSDVTPARAALLELHRRLLHAQRIQAERFGGRMSASELLQAAVEDLRFSWLTELSELIAQLDQARADTDADATQAALTRARALLAPPDPDTAFGARYLQVLQRDPDVVFAHRDATAALTS
jgi:hypothetical protein